MRHRSVLAAVLALAAAWPLTAQRPATLGLDPALDTVPGYMTPGGAFVRSLVLPGWGQSEFGAYFRGGVYFVGWGGNWFMNFRNHVRLHEARNRFDMREDQIREEMIAASPNPDSLRAVIDTTAAFQAQVRTDPFAAELRGLVRAREQQREDWIALTIAWILASGIDAYVTAHLADFPVGVDVERNADRSVTLRVDLPLPRRRP